VDSFSELEVGQRLEAAYQCANVFKQLPVVCFVSECSATTIDFSRPAVELWRCAPPVTNRISRARELLDAKVDPLSREATVAALLFASSLGKINKELVTGNPDDMRGPASTSNVSPLYEPENMIDTLVRQMADRSGAA